MTESLTARTSLALLAACITAVFAACGGGGGADDTGGTVTPGTPGGAAGTAAHGGSATAGSAGTGKGGGAGKGIGVGAGGASGAAGQGVGGQAGKGGGGGAGGQAAGGSAGHAGNGAGGTSTGGKGGSAGKGTGGSSGSAGTGGMGHGQTVAILVSPAHSDILAANGSSAPVQFSALPVYADGTQGSPVAGATWTIVPGDRAMVDGTGLVTAFGTIGGDATISAAWNGLSSDGTVTIKLVDVLDPDALPPADKLLLDGATTPDAAAKWIYPYDQTVFPRGLTAPVLMWDGYAGGDEMKVSLASDTVDLEMYFKPAGPSITIPADSWTKITESGKGGNVTMKVSRLSAGAATVVSTQTWKIASGSLRGTVYYWANSLGRVVRIKPGAAAPDDFLAAAGVTDGCTTCHAVSANGAVLTIGGGTATGDSSASVFDLLGNTLVAKDRGRAWAMLALTPNGKVAALNNAPLAGGPGLNGGLYDVGSGSKLSGTGADDILFDMPSFAPDGSRLLYVDHNTQALTTMPYTDSPPTLGAPTSLVGPSGTPIAFPVISPDGQTTVYHHGPLDTRNGPADLYAASAVNPGQETPLDALNGTNYPFFYGDRDRHLDYEPSFEPIAAGGYYWVVFTSRRTYGNVLTGGTAQVKQLWVAAFDQTLTPGVDPSHPAFWVPGQDTSTLNMRAFWALDPCKDDGATCTTSSQCCGGACLPDNTCGEPPGQGCKPVGATCTMPSDCCGSTQGFQCINSHCTEPKP